MDANRRQWTPIDAARYSTAVLAYIIDQLGIDASSDNGLVHTARKTKAMHFEELARLLNGSWNTGDLVHHCTSRRCCKGWDRDVSVARVAQAIRRTIFRKLPTVPSVSVVHEQCGLGRLLACLSETHTESCVSSYGLAKRCVNIVAFMRQLVWLRKAMCMCQLRYCHASRL